MVETYDYIVVGAGSAGCAVANRLVLAGKTVLLLEAGPKDSSPYVHVPALFYKLYGTARHWRYQTEAQTGYGGRALVIPQGRTLGGGSAVNGMIYIRGQQRDYDDWEAAGCAGWAWDDVLPFFRLSEGNERLRDEFHGVDGPLKVSDPRHRHPVCAAFVEAGTQIGLPLNDDFNGASQLGVGFYQTTTFNGRRMSTSRAFLSSIRHDPLLRLETDSVVTGVLTENGAALGVRYRLTDGMVRDALVREEVVLSAGVFGSPRLLQLSGIGPGRLLSKLGIPVLRDVPGVGCNLQDHITAHVLAKLSRPVGIDRSKTGAVAVKHGMSYLFLRRGVLSSNVLESGGFVDTDGDGRADIQFFAWPAYPADTGKVKAEGHGLTISTCILRPKSRGTVMIGSSDPHEPPRIDTRALAEPDDVMCLMRGLRVARSILRAPALARYVDKELSPCAADEVADNVLEAHIRDVAKTNYHLVGTCRMGVDDAAVVDAQLRVRGVPRLRVADASVMPTLVSGNTNAPAIMIGERCAAFILAAR